MLLLKVSHVKQYLNLMHLDIKVVNSAVRRSSVGL